MGRQVLECGAGFWGSAALDGRDVAAVQKRRSTSTLQDAKRVAGSLMVHGPNSRQAFELFTFQKAATDPARQSRNQKD